jgi:hypothetical protein
MKRRTRISQESRDFSRYRSDPEESRALSRRVNPRDNVTFIDHRFFVGIPIYLAIIRTRADAS